MRRQIHDGDREAGVIDRRASRRFPLRLAVKYRPVGSASISEWTATESVDISSTGVLFTTPDTVQLGQSIEASVAWPVYLDKYVPLKLVLHGSIVRSAGEKAAMHIEKYEFRTSLIKSEANLKAAS